MPARRVVAVRTTTGSTYWKLTGAVLTWQMVRRGSRQWRPRPAGSAESRTRTALRPAFATPTSTSGVLAFATASARAVLTFDRRDFERLHRGSAAHGGIVSCTWDAPAILAARIDQAVTAAGPLAGKHLRINRPP